MVKKEKNNSALWAKALGINGLWRKTWSKKAEKTNRKYELKDQDVGFGMGRRSGAGRGQGPGRDGVLAFTVQLCARMV
jgi:hypothetical protein